MGAKQLDTSINSSFAVPTHIPVRPQGKKSKQITEPKNINDETSNLPKFSSPNKRESQFSDSKSEIIQIKKNKSSSSSQAVSEQVSTENDTSKRKGTSSERGDLENIANISNVDIDDQSDISLNQSINSISTSRSYRQSKSIRAHLVDRYRKEDKKTPTTDNNLDDSLNNSKQKLLLSPERNMSPAKLAFQRKFNRSDRQSPAKTQKHKMPKFDEKWM